MTMRSNLSPASTIPWVMRPARWDDLPQVRHLADVVWRQHYPGLIPMAQIDYMLEQGYALHELNRFVKGPGSGIELACVDAALAGFGAWRVVSGYKEAELDKLYVAPAHQRAGIGGALIARVADLSRAAGARCLVLNVNKKNVKALEAYCKHGFVLRGAVTVDIGGGFVKDDYVMEKPL